MLHTHKLIISFEMIFLYISTIEMFRYLDKRHLKNPKPLTIWDFSIVKLNEGSKSQIEQNWKSGVLLSCINLFITMPCIVLFSCNYVLLVQDFILHLEMFNLLFYGFFIEMWFGSTHKLAHHPVIYKYIHKKHHKYIAPVAINALYAHPVDFGITSVLAICLGPVCIAPHIITMVVYLGFVIVFNVFSHSGYCINYKDRILKTSEYHDVHHLKFNKNYGLGYFFDDVFNTKN